jgi:hypothetical protein
MNFNNLPINNLFKNGTQILKDENESLAIWKTISASAQKMIVIIGWSGRTKIPKKEPHKLVIDSDLADVSSEDNDEKKDTGRRLLDSLISKDPSRKFNVDRRTKGSERRDNADPNYKGLARRNTIDRRLNLKDRREKD